MSPAVFLVLVVLFNGFVILRAGRFIVKDWAQGKRQFAIFQIVVGVLALGGMDIIFAHAF